MVELVLKLVSLRVKTCYKTTALKFNTAGRTSSLASRLLHNLCSEPTPAFFAMLTPFVPPKSSPFQKPQRLHHDDNLPSSLCALLIFSKGRVSTVPTRRSRIIQYPQKLEKLGDPMPPNNAVLAERSLESDTLALNLGFTYITLDLWFTFSKSQCSHLRSGRIVTCFKRPWELIDTMHENDPIHCLGPNKGNVSFITRSITSSSDRFKPHRDYDSCFQKDLQGFLGPST